MPESDRDFGMSWLSRLGREALDPGYAAAARRAGGRSTGRAAMVAWLVAAMLIAGVALGVAVRAQQLNAPSAAKARDGLLADVDRARGRAAGLEASASSLAGAVRSRQQVLGAAGELQTVAALEAQAGMTPVSGPGLSIVVDRGKATNLIFDRDVQLLVNGLWAAGAEAVTVGGIRLRSTSAIRQAGGAILVDNKPTFFPLTIQAIGDTSTMHAAFAETSGFGRFTAFAANYDVRFEVKEQPSLTLPGAGIGEVRYAQQVTRGGYVGPTR